MVTTQGEMMDDDSDIQAEAPAKPDGPLSASGSPQEQRLHDPTAGQTPATNPDTIIADEDTESDEDTPDDE